MDSQISGLGVFDGGDQDRLVSEDSGEHGKKRPLISSNL